MKIFKPELERKKDRRSLLKEELRLLAIDKHKIEQRIGTIKKELEEKPKELTISKHAIGRYMQRVAVIPPTKIRKILSDKTLLERYLKYGPGNYRLKDYPDVIVAITDFTIVTVFRPNDPIRKLAILEEYMTYWLERKTELYRSGVINEPMKFKNYVKAYYEMTTY